jgi:hypothetical protein
VSSQLTGETRMSNPTEREEDRDQQADDPVRDWMSVADTEPGVGVAKAKRDDSARASQDPRKVDREHGIKGAIVNVHYNGKAWCVEDPSLAKALEFDRLDDAEARASELSKDTGHTVCVHGENGELVAAYGETGAKGG